MPPSSPSSSGPAPPLRFGVMCPASGLPRWASECIGNITRDGLAEPRLLIVNEAVTQPSGLRQKLAKAIRLDGNLWHLHNKLFPLTRIPSRQSLPLDQIFGDVPRIVCQPVRKGKWSEYFEPADLEQIREHQLDFILKFSYGIIRGDILTSARHGIWSFHHDDEDKYRGGPPAFWEIVRGDPVTGALLQRLNDRLDGGIVLKKCWVPTHSLSYGENLSRIHFASGHLVRLVCLDLRAGRAEYLEAPASKTQAPIYRAPNDLQMAAFWWRVARNWLRFKVTNQRIDAWNVGLVNAPQSAFLDPAFVPKVEWCPYRIERQFIADPFLMRGGPEPRILVEEFDWLAETGRIAELRRSSAGSPLDSITPVTTDGLHRSYPFVYTEAGQLYMVPECAVSKQIGRYRFDAETGTWQPDEVLIDGLTAVDSTLFEDRQGTWWLFHSGQSGAGPWSLYLWSAPSSSGPWTPHPGNPVKTDVTSARPAGNLFWHEGRLYRPAQDGSRSYGGGLTINRIDELSLSVFRETPVRRLGPDPAGPYPDGLHTLSGAGDWTVIDGKRHGWPPRLLVERFWHKRSGKYVSRFSYSPEIRLAPPAPWSGPPPS